MPVVALTSTEVSLPNGSATSPGWLRPLGELIAEHVMVGRVIHADDTPVPVLAPGAGRTKTGRQWVYLRDERPHGSAAPPAVLYRYTPDRKGEHCRAHLAKFTGWLHADGYAGFGKLYEIAGASSSPLPLAGPPRVVEVACWAHYLESSFMRATTYRKQTRSRCQRLLTRHKYGWITATAKTRAYPAQSSNVALVRARCPRASKTFATPRDASAGS